MCTQKLMAGATRSRNVYTLAPEDILALPSASLAESAPMPVDGKTAEITIHQWTLHGQRTKDVWNKDDDAKPRTSCTKLVFEVN